jgi:hypothetical protein
MYGTIEFNSAEDLAEFLSAFCATHSTAVFRAYPDPTIRGHWILRFDGGY